MKTRLLFTTILIFSTLTIFARQYPGVNYQAVARDSSGNLLANQLVGLKFTVLQNGAGGDTVYVETDTVTTNQYGLFTVTIGLGTHVSGSWIGINWATAAYFVQTSIDATGGTNYADLGSPWELNYVPLAYYALNTADQYWSGSGNNIYSNNTGNVGIGISHPGSQFTNDSIDPLGTNSLGLGTGLEWSSNYGFAAAFYQYSNDIAGGVEIKSSGNSSGVNLLDISTGPVDGSSNPVMVVKASGNVGLGTYNPLALLSVNGNASIGSGQRPRSQLGLCVDVMDTNVYQANSDITDFSRGVNVVNENGIAGEMADISLRTNPNGSDQLFDMKLVDPGSGSSSVIYTFGSPGGFTDQFAFTSGGQLGVGTSTPSAALEVNGNEVLSYGAARTISTPDATGNNITGYDLTLQAGASSYQGAAANGGNLHLVAGNGNNAGAQAGGNITLTTGTNNWNNGDNSGALNGDVIFYGGLGGYQINPSELMRIDGTTGFVGIGTSTPGAPLHVSTANSSGITTPSKAREYFNSGTVSLTGNTSSSGSVLVQADGYFWANGGGFVATSDARIKDIKGKTDNAADLLTLTGIEITDYLYKDKVNNGSKPQKKVIAQQVKEVYPQAINQNEGIIPNVYATAADVRVSDGKTVIATSNPHDFKTGDRVKLIMEKSGEKILPVTVIDDHTFSVATAINEKVFVYGKQVNDLLNVDYDAISMLNVSATQELAKELKAVKEENAQLKAALSALQGQVNGLSAKVDASTAGQVGSK